MSHLSLAQRATRELSTTPIATVSLHACVEVATWKKIQELRKQELPVEHKTTLPFPAAENPPSRRLNVLPRSYRAEVVYNAYCV